MPLEQTIAHRVGSYKKSMPCLMLKGQDL